MSSRDHKPPFDLKTFLTTAGTEKSVLRFNKNQEIFSQGDVADTVFYIQSGQIRVSVVSDQGKEATTALLETGQFFGEGCLNGELL